MKPKFKDFALPITGRSYQILYDPNCPDVTYDELKLLKLVAEKSVIEKEKLPAKEELEKLLLESNLSSKKIKKICNWYQYQSAQRAGMYYFQHYLKQPSTNNHFLK